MADESTYPTRPPEGELARMREVEDSWRVAPEDVWLAPPSDEFHVERTYTWPWRGGGDRWSVFDGDREIAIFFDSDEAQYYADVRNDDRREGGQRV